jgi:hypothetical protein
MEIRVTANNYSYYDKINNISKFTYNKDSISKEYFLELLFNCLLLFLLLIYFLKLLVNFLREKFSVIINI